MQSGYYAATGGMVTQMNRLDTIANNLANANTTGFKRDNVIVGDFARLYQQKRDELPLKNQTKEAASYINRAMDKVPHITSGYTDFSIGNMQKTDNTFDFALSKSDTFFAVNTPNGIRLTRDGSFSLNDAGELVTKEGYEVLPADYFSNPTFISFDDKDAIIEADRNGYFSINQPNSVLQVQSRQMMIVQPDNLQRLKKDGAGMYIVENANTLQPNLTSGVVLQGMIERSNVNAVTEMVSMVETNRLIGMYQKVMDSQMNDMNRDAIEKLAITRG